MIPNRLLHWFNTPGFRKGSAARFPGLNPGRNHFVCLFVHIGADLRVKLSLGAVPVHQVPNSSFQS
jgi:hypothetical protein